ncbi:Ceg1p [Malassezia vespertilionis]|uniref:mRNA guanylyltransferase n=1 Tax=Malassezia vespertilionis TaxID=2020962 RepID=A0A2N1J8M5_9BASI|nr:Ceg1p [Malassezia vespertilionis]
MAIFSFDKRSLDMLLQEDFWVCEKSDGQRVLVLIVVPPMTNKQEVYLIDRKNNYYQIWDIFFPHHNPQSPEAAATAGQRTHTLLDGELVLDALGPNQTKLRLLLFDCIVIDGENISRRSLGRRYARLRSHIFPAYNQHLKRNKLARVKEPFEVMIKPMDLAYGIETVLRTRVPSLQHKNDGLIFTSLNSSYVCGTDPRILKWKPPHENTIDFKLQLRFPPKADKPHEPDFHAKPYFILLQHLGSIQHEFFDYLEMSDDEWEKWKQSGEQLDDRIVECAWHPPAGDNTSASTWHISRIRDDKQNANHKKIVKCIIQSILDGVMEEELLALVPAIRAAWKAPQRL